MNRCIVTYCDDNYMEEFTRVFLPTLRNKGNYSGKVVLLYYGYNNLSIRDPALDIVGCKIERTTESSRYKDVANYLKTISPDTQVLAVDAGDVWYQDDINSIFEEDANKIRVLECNKTWRQSDVKNWLSQFWDNPDKLMDKKLIGGGMICGKASLLVDVFSVAAEAIKKNPFDYFGLDQVAMNYSIYQKEFVPFNPIHNCVILDKFKDKSMFVHLTSNPPLITNTQGIMFTIAHNAGGKDWRLLKWNKKDNTWHINPNWGGGEDGL